jgi:hypothetical protein
MRGHYTKRQKSYAKANPNLTFGSPYFGKVTDTTGNPRQGQLGARFESVNTSRFSLLLMFFLLTALPRRAPAETYYVNSVSGSDSNPGTAESAPWKMLREINQAHFKPGDRILFASGSVWHEQLAPRSSGATGKPIVLDRYGTGPLLTGMENPGPSRGPVSIKTTGSKNAGHSRRVMDRY